MVTLTRLGKVGVALRLRPVEPASVDNHAADAVPVSADPLRRRVNDDVRAVVERASDSASRAERVIDDEDDAGLVSNVGDCRNIGNVVLGVSDRLDVDCFRPCVDNPGKLGRVVAVDEANLDTEALEEDLELVVGPAVERGG